MKLGIMQPYLFPYLGYFQLIHAVDEFVVYDDVNYIKGGWINRNYIWARDGKQLITLALRGASPNLPINAITIGDRRGKVLKTIQQTYGKAPYFKTVFPLVEEVFQQEEQNLARFLDYGLRRTCEFLGLQRRWHLSSALKKDPSLRGQEKILAICAELGASRYINAPGGRALYDEESFASRGMRLSFIQPRITPYRQFTNEFTPNLSIIDVLMFNSTEQCRILLREYDLV